MAREKSAGRESPRTTRVKEIVLDEGIRLLSEHGSAAVTAVRICEATGVARSTIYRHWPDRASLLRDVVERGVRPHREPETTGELETDLRAAMHGLRMRLDRKPFRRVFAALLEQANADDAFAVPQQELVDGVLQPVRAVLDEAVRDGRLPSGIDAQEGALALAGPLLVQHVMRRAPIEDALIEAVLAPFLAALDDG